MKEVIVLDASPLGLLCHPKDLPTVEKANQGADSLLTAGCRIIIAEIADYEVRRELLRTKKKISIHLLNELQHILEYLPLTSQDMLLAAELWAQSDKQEDLRVMFTHLMVMSSWQLRQSISAYLRLLPQTIPITSLGSPLLTFGKTSPLTPLSKYSLFLAGNDEKVL